MTCRNYRPLVSGVNGFGFDGSFSHASTALNQLATCSGSRTLENCSHASFWTFSSGMAAFSLRRRVVPNI